MIPASQDVPDAEHEVAREIRASRSGPPLLGLGVQRPVRVAFDQDTFARRLPEPHDARKVHVGRRLAQQNAGLDPELAAGLTRHPPLEVGPALLRWPGLRRVDRSTTLPAPNQIQLSGEIARRASVAAHVEVGIEGQPRELEQWNPHADVGAGLVERPARIGKAARVRVDARGSNGGRQQRECEREAAAGAHGSAETTRTSARTRSSSR